MKNNQKVTLLHFNDVYDIEEKRSEICGGVSRFDTLVKSFAPLNPILFFSGDLWSPSKLSTIYKGDQCIVPTNTFGIKCSVIGNHDLDFGEEKLIELNSKCNFPWVLSNVTHKNGENLAKSLKTHTFMHEG